MSLQVVIFSGKQLSRSYCTETCTTPRPWGVLELSNETRSPPEARFQNQASTFWRPYTRLLARSHGLGLWPIRILNGSSKRGLLSPQVPKPSLF